VRDLLVVAGKASRFHDSSATPDDVKSGYDGIQEVRDMRKLLLMMFPALILSAGVCPAQQVTGTTIITHGYQATSNVPDWVFSMASAVAARAGDGRVFVYNKTRGELEECTNPYCPAEQGSGGETVIVFDWADDSNESGTGFSQAAAESLFAGLIRWSRMDPPLVDLQHLHLIGHSRGTVVNSETAERLIAAGFPAPQQVTNLDPHDGGAVKRAEENAPPEEQWSWEDFDVNSEHPEYRCGDPPEEPSGICAWTEIGYVDDYWRDIDNLACNVDPDGKPVPGAAVFDASGIDDFCHSDVHTWYAFTIALGISEDPVTGDPPGADWFDQDVVACDLSSRDFPLARGVDGFNNTRIGGGTVRCPDVPENRQEVHFDFALREGLINGGFDEDGSGGEDIPGWSFHGGGGPARIFTWGDQYLDLYGGEWREHNRMYIPKDAMALGFCRRVFDTGSDDVFSILLHIGDEYRVLYEEQLDSETEWECFSVPFLADERDQPVSFMVMLSDSSGSDPNVGVDDFYLIRGLFSDGFESGSTSLWSETNP